MFEAQIRLASPLATLMAALLIMARPAEVSAQVHEVTDAPLAFRNATDRDLPIQWISAVRRNGQEVPIHVNWTYKPGEYAQLRLNNQNIHGVSITFVVTNTVFTVHSDGPAQDGYFRIAFTQDNLRAMPAPVLGPSGGPSIPAAAARHRQFLQQQIARVQAAISQEEDLIARVNLGGMLFEAVGKGLDDEGKRRDNLKDGILGRLGNLVGQQMANKAAQDIAAARARIQANRTLLDRYGRELNPAPVVTPPKLTIQ